MSTPTQTLPPPPAPKVVLVHPVVMLGGQRMVCIQDDCDGTHHFWCSCD